MDNYRGITLLPIIAKLFSAVLENPIQTWATKQGIIPNYRFGFRKYHRTSDPIFVLKSLLEKAKWKHKRLFCCFIDFQKAFDSVSHMWKSCQTWGLAHKCVQYYIPYSRKYWRSIKFGGLAVGEATVKFKSVKFKCDLRE